jgi:DNA-binding SARP family transcriptional activator
MRRLTVLTLRLLRWLTSAAALAALLAGLPWALASFVGWPLPHHWPSPDQIRVTLGNPLTGGTLQDVLACLVWVLWAGFLLAVATEAIYAARGLHAPRIRVFSPVQAVAALLVAGLSIAPAATAVITVPAVPALPAHTVTATLQVAAPSGALASLPTAAPATVVSAPQRPATQPLSVRVADQHYTYQVQRGDTLWHIAGAWLGNPLRWPDIYHLNRDHYDQHGRMRHGDHIEPGWVLILPDDATPPAGAAPAPPPAAPPGPASPPSTARSPSPSAPSPSTAAPSASSSIAAPSSPPATAPSSPDDGVVPPAPVPSVSAAGSAAASPSPTANVAPSSRSLRAQPPGVSLPGGSWVDLGLAAAIAAAATLVWLHRRRRYQPRPPSPVLRLDDPDLAPMPPVVAQVRRGLRRAAAHAAAAASAGAAEALPAELDEMLEDATETTGPAAPVAEAVAVPVAPTLKHPLLQVWPPAGLGLIGPGADAAGRGFLVAALASGGHDEPEARNRVVIPAATLATLLGAHAVTVGDTGRLTVTTGLAEALDVLEEQTLHRTRLVYDHEVDTVAALREADPLEEPLPPLLLIADAAAIHERARIAALLTQGQRLDIHGVLLGPWADGNTVEVAASGATTPAEPNVSRHGPHPADVARLAVLDPAETADLLRTLAEAHTGAPQPAPPAEYTAPAGAPPAADRPDPDANKAPDEKKTTDARPGPPEDAATPNPAKQQHGDPASPHLDGAAAAVKGGTTTAAAGTAMDGQGGRPTEAAPDGSPTRTDHTDATGRPGAGDTDGAVDEPDSDVDRADGDAVAAHVAGPGRARVLVLGPPRIADLAAPQQPGEQPLRSKALEVLVYLVAVGGQAPQHQVIADVLPNELRSRARHRLNTYVSNLRASLCRAGGKASYVASPARNYALNRGALDVDLWRMRDAIAVAEGSADPVTRLAALRAAVGCYLGALAEGRDYEWAEPFREAVRQQAVDAHLALVAVVGDDDPAEAVAVLRAAIGHDPYNELLYQQAMGLCARLGDVDGIRELRRNVTWRMAEIDTEPSEDTVALADRLVTDLRRRPRGPSPLPRDAA